MIWFACSQCGKTHGRSESSVGTFVFCECGQGNTVPWESTTEAPVELGVPEAQPLPQQSPAAPPMLPMPPRLEPVPVGEERLPVARPAPQAPPPPGQPQAAGQPYVRPRDPSRCLNHQQLPSEHTCPDCEERFCRNCIVKFRDNNYCGPCKNAHIRREVRPPRTSVMAMVSMIGGVMIGPLGFCLMPLNLTAGMVPLIIFGILIQLGFLGAGLLAMYKLDKDPYLTGKSLAMTGIVAAAVGIALSGAATAFSYSNWV